MEAVPQLGQFEQLVLTAILALQDDAYGVTIHARVAALSEPRSVSIGAVYVTLERLEQKGLVSSWLSEPTATRGGRAKRCFRLEAAGERALRDSARAIRRLHDALTAAWGRA